VVVLTADGGIESERSTRDSSCVCVCDSSGSSGFQEDFEDVTITKHDIKELRYMGMARDSFRDS
jgi:hypothetical protein